MFVGCSEDAPSDGKDHGNDNNNAQIHAYDSLRQDLGKVVDYNSGGAGLYSTYGYFYNINVGYNHSIGVYSVSHQGETHTGVYSDKNNANRYDQFFYVDNPDNFFWGGDENWDKAFLYFTTKSGELISACVDKGNIYTVENSTTYYAYTGGLNFYDDSSQNIVVVSSGVFGSSIHYKAYTLRGCNYNTTLGLENPITPPITIEKNGNVIETITP